MRLPRDCYQMQQVIETHFHSATVDRPGLVGVRGHPGRERLPERRGLRPLAPGQLELRQYLREWLYDGSDRARPCKTQELTERGWPSTAIISCLPELRDSRRGILRANKRGAWMDPIVELLQALAPAVPRKMTVVVVCDRGLASPKLWKQIRAQSLPPATTGGLASP